MTVPARVTFRWLAETVPTITRIEDYEAIRDALLERRWEGGNFWGLMEALLPTAELRRRAHALTWAGEAA